MSQLNDKINSYALERGIAFNQAFTQTPTRTGTNPLASSFSKNSGTATVYESGSGYGPVGGNGSWNMPISTTSVNNGYFRAAASSATEVLGASDGDYSVGFWFKVNGLPTGSVFNALTLFTYGGLSTYGFGVSVAGSSYSGGSRLIVGPSASNATSLVVSPGTWYYLAVIRNTNATNNFTVYVNNNLVLTATHTSTTAVSSWTMGNTAANTVLNNSFNFSDYYMTTSSVIGPTQIAEIWQAGSQLGTDVTITETPATASLLQVDSTLVVSGGNYTEITTSIPVSAEMVDPSSVVAANNFTHSETIIDVEATFADVIDIATGGDISHSAGVLEASALINEAATPYAALTASAASGNHSVYVTPNYYSKVKALNPYAYFYDGKTSSTSVNGGYQPVTFSVGSNVYTAYDGGLPLNMVGEGDSWYLRGTYNLPHSLSITAPSTATSFDNHIGSGNFSIEFWIKPDTEMTDVDGQTQRLFVSEGFTLNRYAVGSNNPNWVDGLSGDLKINPSGSRLTFEKLDLIDQGMWHHIVVNSSLESNGNISFQMFVDGVSVITKTSSFTPWTPGTNATMVFGGTSNDTHANLVSLDEIAFYPSALSNSNVVDHFNFINTLSPNRTIAAQAITASAVAVDGSFIISANVNYPGEVSIASGQFANPAISASKTIDVSATILEASALSTDVVVKRGWTVYPVPAISYAESNNAFRLNNTYYNYVQANVAPYRYVSFDGNNSYADYGTDNDYAVTPTAVGGSIVNPDFGINGKSAKTAGVSYSTDGVILKESEYNDTWGTGLNNYHSSFWFQRADDDASTTGLRVLWNLNGHYDNQHVILYQYQNKLHLNFNNGSGTHIDQATVSDIDLFDYERHFIVVAFNHTGANSYVNLYVDSVDVMQVNLGSYNGQTVNGTTFVSANDEANNHPRLGVGCLITPFASTALPVQPANTKLYVDEVVWAKSSISQTMVTNLFNVMPILGSANVMPGPITALSESVNPTIITNSNLSVAALTAEAEIVQPVITADREVIAAGQAMTANAYQAEAYRVNHISVTSDIFMAGSSFGDAGVKITIPGGPMIATASIPKNITPKSPVSIYIKYLIGKTLVTQQSLREVK
jgi:hypothetical protein